MTLDDTLTAIDAVTTACEQCGDSRAGSPSNYFCSEPCQRRWMSAQALALPGAVAGEFTYHLEITVALSRFNAANDRLQDTLRRMQWARAATPRRFPPVPGSMA